MDTFTDKKELVNRYSLLLKKYGYELIENEGENGSVTLTRIEEPTTHILLKEI